MNDTLQFRSVPSQFVHAAVLVFLLVAAGCSKKDAPDTSGTAASPPGKPAIVSAEKTSFNEVTAQLDPGGSLYAYLSTSQWLDGLSGRVNGWRDGILSLPDLGGEEKSNINKAFDLITRLIKNSGIESISGVGISGIALEKGFYQTRFAVQRDTNTAPGGIWTVFGQAPRPLRELDWLPADTVWAGFSDLDVVSVWSALLKEADQSGFNEMKAGLERLNSTVQQVTGKKLEELFTSLGGQYGAFLTLNATNKIRIPLPTGGTIEISEPGLALVFKVKDDTLFNWIDRTLQDNPMAIKSDEGDLRMRIVPIPVPLPVTLRLTIARQGDYLFVASTDELVKSMLAVKKGKQPGLKTTAEFKRLAAGMPPDGNSFAFVSQRFGDAVQQIQTSILSQTAGQPNGPPAALMEKIYSFNQPVASFAVGQRTATGWLTVGHGTQQPANAVILPLVVVPTAIMAGMLLPALAKAKDKAQTISCVNNLKQLGLGARIYATDHNGAYPPDFLSMTNELATPKVLICPADPNQAISATLTWANFNPSQSSYAYVTHDITEATPGYEKKVLFRCRIHGSECMGDGSVLMKNSSARNN